MNTFHEDLANSLISEQTFEIMILKTFSRCVGVLYPPHSFFTAYQWSVTSMRVDRERLYMYKKRHFGGLVH